MLLSYYPKEFTVPHTSACMVVTTGMIVTDDMVDIISPVFSSIDFSSGNVDLSSTLSVRVVVENEYQVTELSEAIQATLVCDDGDIFNMYVKLVPIDTLEDTVAASMNQNTTSTLSALSDEELMALVSEDTNGGLTDAELIALLS